MRVTSEEWADTTTPRIGIIGTGNMGRIHARILSSMRALAGVADTDFQRAKEVAQLYDVEAYDDFQSMIEHAKMDGVVVSTPTETHASIVERIARDNEGIRGILIEKPMARTLEDSQKVAALLQKKGMVALVGHSEIYNPVVERTLNLIREGAVGTPQTIIHDRRGFVQPSRIPSLGDVFEDIGVHDFDIMRRISSGQARLYAQGSTKNDVMNASAVMVKFETGTEHFFHLSRQYVGRKRSMDVSGTKGTLALDLFGQIIKIQDLDQAPSADGRTLSLPERGATIKVYGEPVQQVIADFLHCIETGDTPKVSLEDGIAALEIVEAARESAQTGKVIDMMIHSRHV
ncbi:MAG: Gfo/Idh/MocA family protein [Candidatus Thorarchaeota archaeon]